MQIRVGTLRLGRNLQFYEMTRDGWKKSTRQVETAQHVAKLYRAHRALKYVQDSKNPRFLKGMWYKGIAQGERVTTLPNGEVLEKAFSLFSPHLTLHDQDSEDHWDVLYQNKGGTWSYVYTLAKRKEHRARKYRKVDQFENHYRKLLRNVTKALHDKNDTMALPMYTLLKTCMRVGNEIYYKAHKHKGLTTLRRRDVTVKGDVVSFDFVGKDGVPITIQQQFPKVYVKRLRSVLRATNGFIFTRKGKVLHERDFKKAFQKYCGEQFYPHIVRSHYATQTVRKFIQKTTQTTRGKVNTLFLSIANKLGHKKYNKKEKVWQDSHTVTVNSYVQPELVTEVKKLYENNS